MLLLAPLVTLVHLTGDLKEINGKLIAKRGCIPGLTNNPHLKRVTLKSDKKTLGFRDPKVLCY